MTLSSDGRPARPPGPLAGLLLGAVLGVTVFLAASLLHDRFLRRGGPAAAPEGFLPGGDPRGSVRILATHPGSGLQAVLIPLREDGAPAEGEEAILEGALFPAGPRHHWARLVLSQPAGGASSEVSLAEGALRLEGVPGFSNVDLAAAFEARLPALSPHRILDLRISRVPDRRVTVPQGEFLRVLVAFPREADLAASSGMEIPGGPRLHPREVATEALRAVLLDGRLGSLPEVLPPEARVGGTGKGR